MKSKDKSTQVLLYVSVFVIFTFLSLFLGDSFFKSAGEFGMKSIEKVLPTVKGAEDIFEPTSEKAFTTKKNITSEEKKETSSEKSETEVLKLFSKESFTKTPEDISELIKKTSASSKNDEKGGKLLEKQYVSEGSTDSFGRVRVKNLNQTNISIEKLLNQKADITLQKGKPSVLIYHTHTTETYQILDRDFYKKGFLSRTDKLSENMVRVGDEITKELQKNGYIVIHDRTIHDHKYTGAYAHSRQSVEEILKKNPSITITLDVHRDAVSLSDGTKIKPTANIKGKKAAQVMFIAGCQEKGNPVTNLPDWKYNFIFALHFQDKLEELFPGITRPVFFAPRSYNMNVTHSSLLVEVGSDGNTLEEAVYSGRCIGKALSELLKEYEK